MVTSVKTTSNSLGNSNKSFKSDLLGFVLRNVSIISGETASSLNIALYLPKVEYDKISLEFGFPVKTIEYIMSQYLREIYYFNQFFKNAEITWKHDSNGLYRKAKIYLHKIHHIIPVFDFGRARTNLRTMQVAFRDRNFWPQIGTQLAVVIYITDKLSQRPKKILQKNLRAVCHCSAYAFHRTRNKLGLKEKGL